MDTLLIFGATGQLGTDCALTLKDHFHLIPLQRADVDIGDPLQCHAVLTRHRPDVVLNCAAYTHVDEAENHVGIARAVNAEAPGIMAAWVEAHRARLIHVSTDFVFDGAKPPPESYVENDTPNPISVYGQTKLEGETAIRNQTDRYAILRSAWLYGNTGTNFPKTMLRLTLTQPERERRVVNDQRGSPTWSWRLAQQIGRVLETGATGVFHASSAGSATWYEFACAFLDAMGMAHHIVPCATADYPTPACRPPNAVLRNRALQDAHLDLMPDWREDMTAFVRRYHEDLTKEIRNKP